MRFLMIFHPELAHAQQPPTPEMMTAMGRLIEEATKSGVLISTGGTCGVSYGIRVRRTTGGKVTVTDGPYSEAKELVGGYALYELPSKEAAIEHTQRFLAVVGSGDVEIHELGA
jgi:hypothetical protein